MKENVALCNSGMKNNKQHRKNKIKNKKITEKLSNKMKKKKTFSKRKISERNCVQSKIIENREITVNWNGNINGLANEKKEREK